MTEDNFVTKPECEKLHKAFDDSVMEIKNGLCDVQEALRKRNNVDAYNEGFLKGKEEAQNRQMQNIKLWGKVLLAVVIILNGMGLFSWLNTRNTANDNKVNIEKVIEGLRQLESIELPK